VTFKVAYMCVKVYMTSFVRVVIRPMPPDYMHIQSRYSGCLSQAIRQEWFDKSTRHLHLHIWVKSSCIFISNRWSGGADLTLSIFQCLTVRSPIWP